MKKVIYIEDQPMFGEVIGRLIRDEFRKRFHGEVEVEIVPKMEGAFEKISAGLPDVVMIDLSLSDSLMEETIETAIPRLSQIGPPLFVLTGHEDQSERLRVRCFEKGAQDFMTKVRAIKRPEELCERAYGCYLRHFYSK